MLTDLKKKSHDHLKIGTGKVFEKITSKNQ